MSLELCSPLITQVYVPPGNSLVLNRFHSSLTYRKSTALTQLCALSLHHKATLTLVSAIFYYRYECGLVRHLHFVLSKLANINDRSMLGKRDSEIAAIIKDREFVSFKSNLH